MQTVTSPSSNPSPSTAVAFHRHPSNTMPPSFETPTSIEVKKDVDDSDVDVGRVPELSAMASSSKTRKASGSSRKRTAGPADENKRMKRLLRNRVSAQQARERKKAYMTDLETKIKEIEEKNAELEEKLSTLQRENVMLRQIVRNTTMKGSPIIGMSNFEV